MLRSFPFLFALVALGCSGSSATANGSCTTGGVDGGRPFTPVLGCQTDAECTSGTCAHFAGDGPSRCVTVQLPASACQNPSRDACCTSTDCAAGSCFTVTTQPVQCSSTAGADTYNVCFADSCAADADCGAGNACSPTGLEPARACVPAACLHDSDCSAEAGGACILSELGCCPPRVGGNVLRGAALACAYASDGCQRDSDCPGAFCVVQAGRARCASVCQ